MNQSQHTIIIAEAGVNHNGDMQLAKQLIDQAALAEVDYVKFQIFKSENVICAQAEKAQYQKSTTGESESQLEMVKKLELSFSQHKELQAYCQQQQVEYLSTPFDLDSFAYLMEMGLNTIKLPSGEITNYLLLHAVAAHQINVILSTGMSTIDEIQAAIAVLNSQGKVKDITILHCNTQYPTPMQDVNLHAMKSIADATGCPVGYSDHTLGIEVPVAAVALGAVMIEKHFTLDRQMPGPDHLASVEPAELKLMVQQIRNIEQALGSSVKAVSASEAANINIARKFLVANQVIEKGSSFHLGLFDAKRTGSGGVSPMLLPQLIGKVAQQQYGIDQPISAQELG